MCCKGVSTIKKPIEISPRSLIPNRKSEGFPGFPRNESTKVEPKANPTVKPLILKLPPGIAVNRRQPIERVPKNVEPTEPMNIEIEIKKEQASPSPEREAAVNEVFVRQLSGESSSNTLIKVRNDLVKPTIVESILMNPESDDEKIDIEYDSKTVITPHESIPDVRKWDCDEVYTYFTAKAPQFAHLLKENQIDGDALLLIKREDVLNRFDLKLGPALRLYTHIIELQYKNNNPILAWNEF